MTGNGQAQVHGGPRVYAAVLGALVALTVLTVAASYVNFGTPAGNVVAALGIASVKATLVALYFMHLRYDKPLNGVIFAAGLFFLALLLMLTLIDTETRDVIPYWNSRPPAGGPATAGPAAK